MADQDVFLQRALLEEGLITNDQLDKSRSQIVLVYQQAGDGLWYLHEERETAWDGWTEASVGQLKAEVLSGP